MLLKTLTIDQTEDAYSILLLFYCIFQITEARDRITLLWDQFHKSYIGLHVGVPYKNVE